MSMVAVTTLHDAAGADVAKEALTDCGIPVEVRRLGADPYFGSATAAAFELRVPADRVTEAETALAALEHQLAEVLLAAAGVPPSSEDERGSTALPPPELRPRKVAWAIALGLVGPVPGCGLLYARAFRLGWAMLGGSVVLFAAAVVAGNPDWLGLVLGAKIADVLLAPIFAARFNRKLGENNAADA
jgi:hypothetical protein